MSHSFEISIVNLLGMILAFSEIGLSIFKRARSSGTRTADRGSLRLLWGVILISISVGYWSAQAAPALEFGPAAPFVELGLVLFAGGLVLRWYAIIYLGRFFTVNVAIATDHRLIDTGPYRYIRHPSYTGVLMAFLGLSVCLRNWGSLAAINVPTLLAFSWRIRIEEDALSLGLGDRYRDYMRRTKRLIPAIY